MWYSAVVVTGGGGGEGAGGVVVKVWYSVVKAWYCVVSPGGEGGIIYILIADRASTGR